MPGGSFIGARVCLSLSLSGVLHGGRVQGLVCQAFCISTCRWCWSACLLVKQLVVQLGELVEQPAELVKHVVKLIGWPVMPQSCNLQR